MLNSYQILGLDSDASMDDVKKQYRVLVLEYHPDKNNNSTASTKKFMAIQSAYDWIEKNHTESKTQSGHNGSEDVYEDDDPFNFEWDRMRARHRDNLYREEYIRKCEEREEREWREWRENREELKWRGERVKDEEEEKFEARYEARRNKKTREDEQRSWFERRLQWCKDEYARWWDDSVYGCQLRLEQDRNTFTSPNMGERDYCDERLEQRKSDLRKAEMNGPNTRHVRYFHLEWFFRQSRLYNTIRTKTNDLMEEIL